MRVKKGGRENERDRDRTGEVSLIGKGEGWSDMMCNLLSEARLFGRVVCVEVGMCRRLSVRVCSVY